jgi:hypothetical protein
MSKLMTLDAADLACVTGGASNVRADVSSGTDAQMQMMMQQLTTSIQALQNNNNNSSSSMMPMMMMMMMNKQ